MPVRSSTSMFGEKNNLSTGLLSFFCAFKTEKSWPIMYLFR
jgi:hypothetical protein